MRVAGPLLFALVATVGAWSCGTEEGTDGPRNDDDDAGSIDLAYCTRYCEAQASANTLRGTLTECVRTCCAGGGPACELPDGGVISPTDGGRDATAPGDGSTCEAPCGDVCCDEGEGCNVEPGGNPSCVKRCTESKDCASGCCAPATSAAGSPIGPYVCKQNDGKAYHCCNGIFTNCGSAGEGSCCVTDTKGNEFCARKCDSNGQCGEARCVGYTFGWLTTSCQGPTACGP